MASIFLYAYPFVLDCRLFVGNDFPGMSPYTCFSLYLYECLLFAGIFSINVLVGCPFLLSPFSFFLLLGGGEGEREGREREPAPTTGPSSLARGSSSGGTFLAPDWFTEGISMVFMLCTSMSFLSLLNVCHVSMGTSTNLLTDAMALLGVNEKQLQAWEQDG